MNMRGGTVRPSGQRDLLVDGPTTQTVEWYRRLLDWHGTLKEVIPDGVIL